MMKRILFTLWLLPLAAAGQTRPAAADRLFSSQAVETQIARVRTATGDDGLAQLFATSLAYTLDRCVRSGERNGSPDTFVATGDSPAMSLAGSTMQVWPYVRLAAGDEELRKLLAGVINRQMHSIALDPYANAFNDGATGAGFPDDTNAPKLPEVYERKWMLCSLCQPLRLAHHYWKATGDASVFGPSWIEAVQAILRTMREQQRTDGPGEYFFLRTTSCPLDTKPNAGWGNPVRPSGMIASAFRASGDATQWEFNVPQNFLAVGSLRMAAEILSAVNQREDLAGQCTALADQVDAATRKLGPVEHPVYGLVYTLEADGFGNRLFGDDTAVPSLLSMAWVGDVPAYDPIWLNTRSLVLGENNPNYIRGRVGEGLSSPQGERLGMLFTQAIVMRALTAGDDRAEVAAALRTLRSIAGRDGILPVAFHKDDPLTRAGGHDPVVGALFAELVIRLLDEEKGEWLKQ